MKEYNKFIKEVLKDKDFKITKNGRKPTVKLTYEPTNDMYSIHPGDKAIQPIKNWIKNLKNENTHNRK
jgi:hypothetical protein